MPEVVVGVGSNIEPERNVVAAIDRLGAAFGSLRTSPVYRGPAIGMSGADFLNLVVSFHTTKTIDQVEAILTEMESDSGRIRSSVVASRSLDLDLLLYGARVDAARRVPRDDILLYPFVLLPLTDIAADGQHPLTGERYSSAWQAMAEHGHGLQCVGKVSALGSVTG